MCGIVGYIGEKEAATILLNGLKKLEYRGYDSAGIALFENGGLKVVKCKGRLAALEEKIGGVSIGGSIGIGHTRWATHGEPNDINSHPHLSNSGKIAVVHNGIIENYMKLKTFLVSQGFEFVSDTDTEVVAHLVEYYYNRSGDLVKAVMQSIGELEVHMPWGLMQRPSGHVCRRKERQPAGNWPRKSENFIASDIPAILEHTRDVYILEDKEVAVLRKDNVAVYDNYGAITAKETFHVEWDVEAAEKAGFEHFMIKEIFEEPKVVRDTVNPRISGGRITLDNINITPEYLEDIERVFIVACGTAYHAGMIGKYLIEKLARIPVETDLASEFRYRDPIIGSRNLVIIISQSGETIDTLFALRRQKEGRQGFVRGKRDRSSIARESDDVLYTCAGPEIAVASTKAYNAQLAALTLIALDFAAKRGVMDSDQIGKVIEELQGIPAMMEKILAHRKISKSSHHSTTTQEAFSISEGTGLCTFNGRLAETQRNFLYTFGSLCGRRTEARHYCANRGRHAGSVPDNPGQHGGENGRQHTRGEIQGRRGHGRHAAKACRRDKGDSGHGSADPQYRPVAGAHRGGYGTAAFRLLHGRAQRL